MLGLFSGIVNEHDRVRLSSPAGSCPASWRTLLGPSVDEFDPQPSGTRLTLRTSEGLTLGADLWAEVLASFNEGFYAGSPAGPSHRAGLGQIFCVGTRLGPEGLAWLIGRAAQEAGVAPDLNVPAGVKVLTRCGERGFLFVLNHNAHEVAVPGGPLCIAATGLAAVQLDAGH